MSSTLLQNVQKIQTTPNTHPVLFEQALWELLKLYNEHEENVSMRMLHSIGDQKELWGFFQKEFEKEVRQYTKGFNSTQLEEIFRYYDMPINDKKAIVNKRKNLTSQHI